MQKIKHFLQKIASFNKGPSYKLRERFPQVSIKHLAQFDGPSLVISHIGGGHPSMGLVADLRLVERAQTWVSSTVSSRETAQKLGASPEVVQTTMTTQTLDLVLTVPGGNRTPEPIVIESLGSGEANRAQALKAFDRVADELLVQMFPYAQTRASLTSAPIQTQAPWIKRALWKLMPWVGGGLLVVGFSLAYTASKGGVAAIGAAQLAAAQAQGQGQVPGQSLGINALNQSINPAINPLQAPQAWEALPDAQKQIMLQLAQRAADSARAATGAALPGSAGTQGALGAVNSAAPTLTHLTPEQMKQVKAGASLKLGDAKNKFYVFEDPFCPSCQDFAKQSKALDKSMSTVVLPIAFQPGARDRAAAALCAPDPVRAWALAMTNAKESTKPCDAGYKKIDDNNALFLALGFSSTPTSIAPNGALAAGSATTAEIASWVMKNQS